MAFGRTMNYGTGAIGFRIKKRDGDKSDYDNPTHAHTPRLNLKQKKGNKNFGLFFVPQG